MDVFHKLMKFLDHYRWPAASVLVSGLLTIGTFTFFGCQSKTLSLLPGSQGQYYEVDRREFVRQAMEIEREFTASKIEIEASVAKLNGAVETHNAKVEEGVADLDKQDALKTEIFDAISVFAADSAQGDFNLLGLLGIAGTILLGGTTVGATGHAMHATRALKQEKAKNGKAAAA